MTKKQLVDLVNRLKDGGKIDVKEAYYLLLAVMKDPSMTTRYEQLALDTLRSSTSFEQLALKMVKKEVR